MWLKCEIPAETLWLRRPDSPAAPQTCLGNVFRRRREESFRGEDSNGRSLFFFFYPSCVSVWITLLWCKALKSKELLLGTRCRFLMRAQRRSLSLIFKTIYPAHVQIKVPVRRNLYSMETFCDIKTKILMMLYSINVSSSLLWAEHLGLGLFFFNGAS